MALKRLLTAPLVTFDAFHTLYEARGSASQQYVTVAGKFGISADRDNVEKAFMSAYKQTGKEYPLYGKNSGISVRDWWKKVILKTFEPEPISDTVFNAIYEHFNTPDAYTVYEDARKLIRQLEKNGVSVGVLTNTDPAVKLVLKKLGYSRLSDNCLTSYDMGYEKPDIKSFKEAVKRFNIENNALIWHVGDDLDADVKGCAKVGWNSILIDRRKTYSAFKDDLREDDREKRGNLEYDDNEMVVFENLNGSYQIYTEDLTHLWRLDDKKD